jgi:hypothetical protein
VGISPGMEGFSTRLITKRRGRKRGQRQVKKE